MASSRAKRWVSRRMSFCPPSLSFSHSFILSQASSLNSLADPSTTATANTMDVRDGHGPPSLTLRPLLSQAWNTAASVQTPAWPGPVAPYPHALLPDSTDQERVSDIDQHALRNLRSFQNQHGGDPADDDFRQSHSPASTDFLSPRPLFNPPASPNYRPLFVRRHSVPVAGRRATPEAGMLLIVAEQLQRPSRPVMVTPDLEFWWPFQPNGEVEMRVGIVSRRGHCRAKKVRLSVARPQHSPPCGPEQHLMPGSVLPVPGQSDWPLPGRRFSTGNSSIPTRPRAYKRRSGFEFPAQLINTQLAMRRLAVFCKLLNGASGIIREHDEIIMPMPYPSAWPETILFIHTGNAAYLSETVRSNLLNLGGGLF